MKMKEKYDWYDWIDVTDRRRKRLWVRALKVGLISLVIFGTVMSVTLGWPSLVCNNNLGLTRMTPGCTPVTRVQ